MLISTQIRQTLNHKLQGQEHDNLFLGLPKLRQNVLYQNLLHQHQTDLLAENCAFLNPLFTKFNYEIDFDPSSGNLKVFHEHTATYTPAELIPVHDPIVASRQLFELAFSFILNLPEQFIIDSSDSLSQNQIWQIWLFLRKLYYAGYQIEFRDALSFDVIPPNSPYDFPSKAKPGYIWLASTSLLANLKAYANYTEEHLRDAYQHTVIREIFQALTPLISLANSAYNIDFCPRRVHFVIKRTELANHPEQRQNLDPASPLLSPDESLLYRSFRFCRTDLKDFILHFLPPILPPNQTDSFVHLAYKLLNDHFDPNNFTACISQDEKHHFYNLLSQTRVNYDVFACDFDSLFRCTQIFYTDQTYLYRQKLPGDTPSKS